MPGDVARRGGRHHAQPGAHLTDLSFRPDSVERAWRNHPAGQSVDAHDALRQNPCSTADLAGRRLSSVSPRSPSAFRLWTGSCLSARGAVEKARVVHDEVHRLHRKGRWRPCLRADRARHAHAAPTGLDAHVVELRLIQDELEKSSTRFRSRLSARGMIRAIPKDAASADSRRRSERDDCRRRGSSWE